LTSTSGVVVHPLVFFSTKVSKQSLVCVIAISLGGEGTNELLKLLEYSKW